MNLRIKTWAEERIVAFQMRDNEKMTDLALFSHMMHKHGVKTRVVKHDGLTYLFMDDYNGTKGYCFGRDGRLLRSNRTITRGCESDSNMSELSTTEHTRKSMPVC